MDLSEVSKLDAPAKVLKLSEAVRAFGYESPFKYQVCVLGKAISGITGLSAVGWVQKYGGDYHNIAARLFNVPNQICRGAESMCMDHTSPDEIADWLESQGY